MFIVGLVCGVEQGLDLAALEEVVARAGGGRAKRRRLAQALADRPAVLTDGRSPAPRPVGDLLIALRKAGATTVSPPVCAAAGCGRPLRALRRRGQDWYCAGCTRTWEPCTACGKTRKVNTRGRDGHAYCQFCGPAESADPVEAVVRVVTTIDSGLAATVVAGAVTEAARQPGHRRQMAWALQDRPGLLTGTAPPRPSPRCCGSLTRWRAPGPP